jgi:hypothetical protein
MVVLLVQGGLSIIPDARYINRWELLTVSEVGLMKMTKAALTHVVVVASAQADARISTIIAQSTEGAEQEGPVRCDGLFWRDKPGTEQN